MSSDGAQGLPQVVVVGMDRQGPATRAALETAGFCVVEATSASEALDRLSSTAAAIVIDAGVGDVPIATWVRALRERQAGGAPVVIHVGRVADAGPAHGIDAFVPSWDPALVVANLHALVAARAEHRCEVELRDELLAVVSHELRSPVTSIQLYLQSVMRRTPDAGPGPASELVRRHLGASLRHLGRLQELADRLLEVSRLSQHQPAIQMQRVDVSRLVQRLCDRFRARIEGVGSPFTTEIQRDVIASADEDRLAHVVATLLANAVKFGPGGSIRCALTADRTRLRLTVADDGVGIPPEHHERIFQRLARVSERHEPGLGLGLFVAREIVKAHGGVIQVDSRPGAGATFVIELPLAPADPDESADDPS